MSRRCWRVAGHLQTHEEPREAAHTQPTQGQIHQHCSHCGQSCQDHPTPMTEQTPNPRAAMQPQPFHLCRTKLGDTVGGGVELQAERASTALQGTLLPAQAAVGAARLQAPAAAPGCVVGAGETIKLQSQRIG